ncbi:unnamed protein product, partial [Rotaria socialis]
LLFILAIDQHHGDTKEPSIHRRETGQAYFGAHSTYRPHIDLPVVCSIHARSMSVREEPWLSIAPPR